MKFTPVILVCSFLLAAASAPSFAINEVSRTWYPAPLNGSALKNAIVAETTLGCIDKDMMYVKHTFKANSQQWYLSRDYVYLFLLLSENNPGGYISPLLAVDTSKLHNSDGSTFDAYGNAKEVTFYNMRPYAPITSVNNRILDYPHFTRDELALDPMCDFL
ncbi:hypothetical protein [Thalassomonas sp. RHCl1]|uniref:hypothetical protein n=1 Tax=Thalassomonas sp. RHCl1 TaxID=2995320 RepID=UPI00248BB87B|nr:hypothetical protein [Thalassomonas sp. RHCl1]